MSYCTADITVNPPSKVPIRTIVQDLIVPQEFIVFYPLAAGGIFILLLQKILQNIVICVLVKPCNGIFSHKLSNVSSGICEAGVLMLSPW